MGLWVRNQDRENLVKVGLLEINERENDYAILTIYENRTANLGLYKSKERALEVLDEIQNALLGNDRYDYSIPPTVSTITGNLIFEMPGDEN